MEAKIIEWLKIHRKKIILYSFIGFVVVFNIGLLFVQVPYWIGNKVPLIKTDFYPEDVLSFLGDFISAAGTIILGIIAIIQTDKAYELANDANKVSTSALEQAQISNKLVIEKSKPKIQILIKKIVTEKAYVGKLGTMVFVVFRNCNESAINDIKISSARATYGGKQVDANDLCARMYSESTKDTTCIFTFYGFECKDSHPITIHFKYIVEDEFGKEKEEEQTIRAFAVTGDVMTDEIIYIKL